MNTTILLPASAAAFRTSRICRASSSVGVYPEGLFGKFSRTIELPAEIDAGHAWVEAAPAPGPLTQAVAKSIVIALKAAEATLDSIAATGSAINEADANRLWPGVIIKIDESEGTGQWKGLKLVNVTAGSAALNKKVEVRLSRYFSKGDIAISKADIPASKGP